MFGPQTNTPNEQLFATLRHYAKTGSMKMMENIQAELWRRGISQKDYLEWLKGQQTKES